MTAKAFLSAVRVKLPRATTSRLADLEAAKVRLAEPHRSKVIAGDFTNPATLTALLDWIVTPSVPWRTGDILELDGVFLDAPPGTTLVPTGATDGSDAAWTPDAVTASTADGDVLNSVVNRINSRIAGKLASPNPGAPTRRVIEAHNDRNPRYAKGSNYRIVFEWVEDVGGT